MAKLHVICSDIAHAYMVTVACGGRWMHTTTDVYDGRILVEFVRIKEKS